jgi:hypothetical protein
LGSPPFCRSSLYFSRLFSRSSDRCTFFFSTRKACYQQCFGFEMFIPDPIFSIPDPDPDFLPIPDPGSRGQKGTGSRSATLIIRVFGSVPYPCLTGRIRICNPRQNDI